LGKLRGRVGVFVAVLPTTVANDPRVKQDDYPAFLIRLQLFFKIEDAMTY
jgi:hypothetical protein